MTTYLTTTKTWREFAAEGWTMTHVCASEYVLRRGCDRIVLAR